MALSILTWIFIFVFCSLWGLLVERIMLRIFPSDKRLNGDKVFFLGFGVVSLLASYSSLIIPVNYFLLGSLMLPVLVFSFMSKDNVAEYVQGLIRSLRKIEKRTAWAYGLALLFVLAACSRGIIDSDSELYHLQSIRWIREYSVVPGLGNLHGRLAFNSMAFPVNSLFTLDIGLIQYFPLNGLLFVLLGVRLLKGALESSELSWKRWFKATLFFLALFYFTPLLSSPQPDITVGVLVIYSALLFLDQELQGLELILAILLVCTIVTYKLSAAPFLLILPVILSKRFSLKRLLSVALIGAAVLLPFLMRNYYLSGYLAYPFANIDVFDVDWKIPRPLVEEEQQWIKSWAKIPGQNAEKVLELPLTSWLPLWWTGKSLLMQSVLALGLISSLLAFFYRRIVGQKSVKLGIVMMVSLIFWFITAPDPRFAFGVLFLACALSMSILLCSIRPLRQVRESAFSKIIIVSILISMVHHNKVFLLLIERPHQILVAQSLAQPELVTYSNGSMLYYVPKDGGDCNYGPLPCTPYANDQLQSRSNKLSSGFRVVDRSVK